MLLWTAFTIGLLGSVHCIGMCGPIALALPYGKRHRALAVLNALKYNLGRVFTYMLLGLLFGLIGQGVFLAGYQSALSVVLGILMLLLAFFSLNLEKYLVHSSVFGQGLQKLKTSLARLLKVDSKPSFFLIGLLNGLLPCGLVYMAVVGAVSTGNALMASFYMGLFGLGTLPLMLTTSLAGHLVSLRFRKQLQRLLPLLLVAMGILFLLRGLNFHLPADFYLWDALHDPPMCH